MALGWSAMTYGIVSWGQKHFNIRQKIQSAQDRVIKLTYVHVALTSINGPDS